MPRVLLQMGPEEMTMHKNMNRREIVKGGLASLGLAAIGIPLSELPALAEDETLMPFLDFPANFNANPPAG